MKILAINSGSSSLKFSLFNMDDEAIVASGLFERIGIDGSNYTIKYNGEEIKEELIIDSHVEAVRILLDKLITLNIISSYNEIGCVGHRILHGKDVFDKSIIIDEDVLNKLEELIDLGPLHMKANVGGVRAFMEVLPNTPMVAVFDTAFHQTMDKVSYMYPVPYDWYEKYGVRKYGFHGISHRFVCEEAKKILNKDHFKLISCHLGSGASICAIEDGKCVDTSMGFTPLAGVMMGTRSGDVDPSIIPYVMEKDGKNALEVINELNKDSGLLGLSEYSSDMRDILAKCDEEDERAILAKNKFVRRVVDYIGSYYLLLGGVDMIVFTAGVGENSVPVRREICEKLSTIGVKINLDENQKRSEFVKLSTEESSVLVYVIPTNEELVIARDSYELVRNGI